MNTKNLENLQSNDSFINVYDDIDIGKVLDSSNSSISSLEIKQTNPLSVSKTTLKERVEYGLDLLNSTFQLKSNQQIDLKRRDISFSKSTKRVNLTEFISKRGFYLKLIQFYMKKYKKYRSIVSLRHNLIYAIKKRQGSIYLQMIIKELPFEANMIIFNIVSILIYDIYTYI